MVSSCWELILDVEEWFESCYEQRTSLSYVQIKTFFGKTEKGDGSDK